ncbi:hypothetical protein DPMN_013879 [Dreissena polymorpha]|uniref:Uncharacterized protein n=1 Tax=Dreissena polymorpha TaxID=45954 RepID=A0A9D4S423_DREPO|nr:hypothetical protein DPMN_013879 [Dreissena polymorpha]
MPVNYTAPDPPHGPQAYLSELYCPRLSTRTSSLSQQTILAQTIHMDLQPIPAKYTAPDHPHGTPAYPTELYCPKQSTRISILSQRTILP